MAIFGEKIPTAKTLQGVSSTDAFSSESRVPLAGEFVGVGGIGKSRTLKFFFFKGKGEDGINSGNDDDNNDSNDNSNDNNNSSSNNHIHQEPKDASLGDPNLLGNSNPRTLVHAFEALQKKRSIKQIHCKPQGSSNAFGSGQFGRDKRQLKLLADEPDCEK